MEDITQGNLKDVPEPCKACLYWENPVLKGKQQSTTEKTMHTAEKAEWFLKTLKEFGNCGKIIYADNKPVGYAQYSSASRLPNTQEYGAKKLGTTQDKVAFISCLYISNKDFRGKGLGKKLLDEVILDLKNRGFNAVETFARESSPNNPSGPIQLYLKKGFHVRERLETNHDFALVRLDL
ncbi:MAG: GNAT family N-acetyltransferase [Candidatus Bathyarchaeota archaeon]|nr:GNAT family N-acetyltransferase [Candidatus Bathyarchaeota archaeon]